MNRLLKIEFHKILFNRSVWIIFGLHWLLFILSAFVFDSLFKTSKLPQAWHNLAYMASWFKLFLALIIIILVTNEYSYRTLKQNIVDGLSKWETIWAKELVIFIISIISAILLVIVTLIIGKKTQDVSFFKGIEFALLYFISLVYYLNFAYFLSTWLKKSGFVIGILLLYSIIVENIIAFKLPDNISNFLPVKVIDNMIAFPQLKISGDMYKPELTYISPDFPYTNVGICILYTIICIGAIYLFHKKGKLSR